MPPSERAKCSVLYLRRMGDQIRSAAACTMLIGCRLIITSIGALMEVMRICDDEPRCMHTTVPSSAQAVQKGSQWSECSEGHPSFSGFSENVTAWQPFLATRCTSSAPSSGSQMTGMDRGMERPGSAPHHLSMCQSL